MRVVASIRVLLLELFLLLCRLLAEFQMGALFLLTDCSGTLRKALEAGVEEAHLILSQLGGFWSERGAGTTPISQDRPRIAACVVTLVRRHGVRECAWGPTALSIHVSCHAVVPELWVWFGLRVMWWKPCRTGSWKVWLRALPHIYSYVTSLGFRDVSSVMGTFGELLGTPAGMSQAHWGPCGHSGVASRRPHPWRPAQGQAAVGAGAVSRLTVAFALLLSDILAWAVWGSGSRTVYLNSASIHGVPALS